jgi:hypothetical protein
MYAGIGGERHSGHEDVRAHEVPMTLSAAAQPRR